MDQAVDDMSAIFDGDGDPGPVPPHNPGAEQALIAACLTSTNALNHALTIVTPDDFYLVANQRIYAAMGRLHHTGQPIDVITVADETAHDGGPPVGAAAVTSYLAGIYDRTSHSPRYALIVHRDAEARRLLAAAEDMRAAIYALDDTAIDHAGKRLLELLAARWT